MASPKIPGAHNKQQHIRDVYAMVLSIKNGRSCADCKQDYPVVCKDFDHRNDKYRDVSLMVQGNWSISRVLKEIEKCDIVCANCHRIRTFIEDDSGDA